MVLHKAIVTPSVNFLVKSKTETKEISKVLRFIFVFYQVIFGLDNGFIRTKTLSKKILVKMCCILQVVFVSSCTCYGFLTRRDLFGWFFSIALIYFLFAIVLLSCKYSYYDFLNDLYAFDKEICADHLSYRLDLRIIANVALVLLYSSSSYIIRNTLKEDFKTAIHITFDISFFVCLFAIDFVRIIYFLVFSSACWRIKKFIKFVKRDNVDIAAYQYLYKRIADITEKAKANFNLVFIVTLIYNSVTITVQLFLPFAGGSVKSESALQLTSDILGVVKNLLIMFAPTYTGGLLASEVENLVLALRDKVLVAKDEKQRVNIRRFIGYIEARPLKFTVCGVVPLDWNLPVIVVNMAFTYLIVMIQFTHKY